jgi:hypothetical protein
MEGEITLPYDVTFDNSLHVLTYEETCASHNFISPLCIRALEKRLLENGVKEEKKEKVMHVRIIRDVNITFSNNTSVVSSINCYDILVRINNEKLNKEILFIENFIEYDTGVEVILSDNTQEMS